MTKDKLRVKKAILIFLVSFLFMAFTVQAYGKGAKRIAILGDSYSAYYGMIPKGYDCSYAIRGIDGENKWKNNINSVKQMWWYRLMKTSRYKLTVNCSYSGSCFGYIYKGGRRGNSSSFISRMKEYLNGRKKKADIIFVQGGTNDSWRKRPVGNVQYSRWTSKKLYKSLPAFCYILHYLKKHYPKARIIVLINDKYIRKKLLTGMVMACDHYHIPYLMLGDISTQSRHPDQTGQMQIYQTVSSYLG